MKEATKKRDFEKVVQLRGRYDIKQLLTPTFIFWSKVTRKKRYFMLCRFSAFQCYDCYWLRNETPLPQPISSDAFPRLLLAARYFLSQSVRTHFPRLVLAARIFPNSWDWSFSLCVVLSIAKYICVIVIFRTFKSNIEIFKVLRKVEPPASSECDLSGECKVCHSLLCPPTPLLLPGWSLNGRT